MPRSSRKNYTPVDQTQALKGGPNSIETIRHSDSRFRAVFENAAVGIARVGLDGRWLEVNQRLCDIICYDRSDLMTKTFAEITHPDDLAEHTRQVERMLASEIETYVMEKRFCRKSGSLVWINLTVSLVRKPDGSPDYLIAIVEDISSRKRAEEKLRESEERLRLATEAAGLGVFEWNVKTDFAVWENERMYEIFGHTPDDGALSKAQFDELYVFPDDVATLEQALNNGAKSGRSFHTAYRIRRKDGAMRWLSLSATLERSPDGSPVRMIGVLGDITERRRVEDTLRASEEQFRILTDTAPVMIWISGTDKLCSFFNKPWLDFTGRTMDQQLGRGWTEGVYPDDYDRCLGTYVTSFEAREPFKIEYRLRRFDGEYRWILDHGVPRFSSNGDFLGYIGSCIDITERKEIEQALRASELRFRMMISAIPGLTYEGDANGNNTFSSGQWCAYTGMTAAETAGRGFLRSFHPDDAPDFKARYETAVRSGTELESRLRIRAADGSYRWFLNRALPGHDAEGRIVRWAGSLTDIDDLVRAEQKLRESELRFRTMISAVPSLTYETDTDGNNIFVSDQWFAYTGMTAEETAWSGYIRAYHPDEAENVLAQWSAAVRSGMSFESKCRIRGSDGSYRWFLNRAQPGRDPEGRIVRWAGSLTDIDDLIRAEERLRESKERLAGILSTAMDAIITVDEEQRVVLFNEAAERIFGCPSAEAMGQALDRFIPECFPRTNPEHIRFGESGGASRAMARLNSLTALRKDGTVFPIEAAISKIEVAGRKYYTIIYRDITERKQAEAEREKLAQEQLARAAAEAANRSKDEFLAMVSHELRSPLSAIIGYSQILRSGPADRERIDNATAVIERNAKMQNRIIDDLLDSARIVTGKLRIELLRVDLVPVLESALDTVRPAAEAKGVALIVDFGLQPEEVLGDPTRLEQVVWNLLTNAIKFTSERGRIELRMEDDSDHIRITVRDTGRGIEPGFLPLVFERFRQADSSSGRRVGGLGLGLSLAKHLVELHGGTITAASEGVGRGSTFTVTLPRRRPEFIETPPVVAPGEVRTEGSQAMDQALLLEGVSTLVVDDQEEVRVTLAHILSQYGAEVTAVSSGSEALAFLADPLAVPNVLILDIAMPDEDGYTVLKKVRASEAARGVEKANQIPAIALTAFARSEDRLRALQAGFDMHVAKPVEPAELAVVIASLTSRLIWRRKPKQ